MTSSSKQLITQPFDYLKWHIATKAVHGQKPICGVHAVAVATGHPYMNVYEYFLQRKSAKWKGRLPNLQILNALKDFGAELEECRTGRFRKLHRRPLVEVAMDLVLNDTDHGVYVIFTRNHVQVVQDYKVVDQSQIIYADKYHLKNRRVKMIFRVKNADELLGLREQNLNKELSDIMSENVIKKPTKSAKANEIVREKIAEGLKRKEILAILVSEVDTTWDSASMMYHKVKKEIAKESLT